MTEETPYFRELYELLWEYKGYSAYWDVLEPWLPQAKEAIAELERYRKRNSSSNPYIADRGDLGQWYALSRVNDYLLLSFQTDKTYYEENGNQRPSWRAKMAGSGISHVDLWEGSRIYPHEYTDFFLALAFTPSTESHFHSFYHEIVEVEVDNDLRAGEVAIDHYY